MSKGYKVKIGDIVINGADYIESVDFKIYQKDETATDKSDQLYNSVIITGKVKKETINETKQLAEWSKKTDRSSIYKSVKITINVNDEQVREYFIDNMFCVSYEEYFSIESTSNDDQGKFTLILKQRKDTDTIKSISIT